MAVLDIIEYPDEVLRAVSAPVTVFDAELLSLVEDLFETLAQSGAIGLSAPQVGALQQVLVVHVPGDEYGPRAYINPELRWSARPGLVEESCLSVPGIVGSVFRATQVRVAAVNASGEAFEQTLEGMHAVCLQHEMDHLGGGLFIDRLSWFSRLRLKWAAVRAGRSEALAG